MARRKVAQRARYVRTGLDHIVKSETANGWSWFVRHPRQEDGRRPYEKCTSREAAIRLRNEIFGADHPVSEPNATLADVVDAWRRDCAPRLKPRSRDAYESVIKHRLQRHPMWRLKLRQIRPVTVERWLKEMKRLDGRPGNLDDGTRAAAYACLRSLLSHAVYLEMIGSVPILPRGTAPRQGPGRTRILTAEEEAALFGAIRTGNRPWLEPVVVVALAEGLRIGEAAGLRWEDIGWDDDRLTIARQIGKSGVVGTPKSGAAGSIRLMPQAKKALLERRMQAGRPESGFVFDRSPQATARAMEVAVKSAGLEDVSFHTLRHTCASRLANNPGVPLVAVRDHLRHSSITVTEKYLHEVADENVADAMAEAVMGA